MSPQIDQLVRQATEAQQQRRFHDAKSCWSNAVELMRGEADELALARALRALGETERKLRDPAARQHYEEAVARYRLTPDSLGFAHTLRHLGDLYHESGEPALAEPCYREALAVYEKHPTAAPLDMANALRSTAVLQTGLGNCDRARQLWEDARQLYASSGVQAGVAESSTQLARLAAQAG